MERIYRIATAHPYQFLYVDLRSTDPNNTFYIGFSQVIRVNPALLHADARFKKAAVR